MNRYLSLITIIAGLAGCTAVPQIGESEFSSLHEEIRAIRQNQEALQEQMDTLAMEQVEANEGIRSEMLKTQSILAESKEAAQQRSIATSSAETSSGRRVTKAEWMEREGKVLVGGVEHITFTGADLTNLTYEARIDTGATSSSLDAREVTRFERDGDRWVRFKLFVDEEHFADVERPVIRWVRVFQSGTEEGERRPVVELSYQFGDISDTAEFTLTDRAHLEFPALVGRNIMTDRMIVDVSERHIFSDD